MKKGMYITSYDLKDKSDGVAKKIASQITCLKNTGCDVEIIDSNSMPSGMVHKCGKQFARVFSTPYIADQLYKQVASRDDLAQLDFIYIRKGYSDMSQIYSLKSIKGANPSIKIMVEIPTYPYDQEFGGRRKLLAIPNDKKARNHYKEYVDRIITYSNDKEIFGVTTINIMNGIDYCRIRERTTVTHDGIHLLAVAFFDYWHGYDRLLKGMAKDIDLVRKHNVVFDLVGDGRAISNYKKIVSDYGLKDHVIFHGRMFGDALDDIYNYADIGIDTLGRHRVGIYYNSTLKGKEYCAKGIPILSGVKTDLDDMNINFYFRVPADESVISIKEVIDFYHSVYDGKTPEKVSEEIRKASKVKFDFSATFAPVVCYITKD